MIIKQISVFVENKPGRLAQVIRTISDAGCNILALTIADTTDFGVLRLIVDDPAKAVDVLRANGLAGSVCDVISVSIVDEVGGLSSTLDLLTEHGIDVEYMYVFVGKLSGQAQVVMRVDDPEKAQQVLFKSQTN